MPFLARHSGLWIAVLVMASLVPPTAQAQRPFPLEDPFYRNESARRPFFDRYAFTTDISYQPSGIVQTDGLSSADPLGLRFRLDYQLADHFDVGGIVEALGTGSGRTVTLSWVLFTYSHYLEHADYAVRVAVDPSTDGRAGFPQVDLAFLYTSLLSPAISSDFALGLRRVNVNYTRATLPAQDGALDGPFGPARPLFLLTRALGTELHAMVNYNVHFDPAGSNLFLTLMGEGGQYDIFETLFDPTTAGTVTPLNDLDQLENETGEDESPLGYRGGALWIRAGMEFSRPSYQISPYLAAPAKQWSSGDVDGSVSRLHIGFRFMLR